MTGHIWVATVVLILSIMIPQKVRSATIWPATTIPGIVDSGPDSAVELGVKFRSDVSGTVTGIRFYKASTNTGTHVANLWSGSGARLATATFSNETASGWQQVNFTTPVAINANTIYVASYHTNTGHYSDDQYFFLTSGVDSPPLHAPADGVSGYNGVYAYGSGSSYPSLGWRSSNYWVDVVFSPSAPQGPDTTPPTVPGGLAATPYSTSQINLTWAASADPVISGQITSGVMGYNVFRDLNVTPIETTTATTYSDSALQPSTVYSYTVNAFDIAGNVSAQTAPVSATTPPTDVIPPSVPGNLSAVAVSSTQIDLSWSASLDNVAVAGYQVFRDGQLVAATATTSCSDTGLTSSTAYIYTVKAVDSSGNISEQSLPVSATTITLAFVDEFDGDTLDTTKWVAMNRPGDSSNNEVQYYLPTNAVVSNGWLNITSKVDNSVPGYSYSSEMVQWKNFNFTYGTVEFRAKLAGGQGPWPAIWLLGSNCQQTNVISADNVPPCHWPDPGSDEINITEVMNGNLTAVNQQIHSGSVNVGCLASTEDVSKNWHDYGFVWEPGSATWLIDGVITCKVTNGVPTTPMFLMVNTAMGGIGGGAIIDSTLPQTSSLDYLRVTLFDTIAPTVPVGLTATAVSTSQINLSWSASTDNVAVAGYRIFRGGGQIATVTGTAYNSTGLTASTEYLFTVSAYDAAGNNSDQSSPATATTLSPDIIAPTVSLSSLSGTVSGAITVSAIADDNVGVTKVEFYLDNVLQATDTAIPFRWSWDTTQTSNASHILIAKAYDAVGNVGTSNTATVTVSNVDTIAPVVPTGLSATVVSTSQINLSWNASTDNVAVTGYKVFRDGVQITSTVTGTTFSNAGLSPSTTYSYTVLAYDAAGNNSVQSPAVSATTLTPDTTVPTVSLSPSSGTVSGTITVLAAVNDNVGVTSVEFYLDDALQYTDSAAPFNWLWNTVQTTDAPHNIYAKAYDAAGNVGTSSTVTLTVSNSVVTPSLHTIWLSTTVPGVVDSGPDIAVELGVKFRSDVNGFITGIRFYKASANSGTHIGNLWSASGTCLATGTFVGETASGWQQLNFATPVAIAANTVYIASYHTNAGHYSCDQNYFSGKGFDNPPLHALAAGVSGVNGVYSYGTASSFPSLGWNSSNYWVDVVLSSALPPPITLSSIALTPVNQSLTIGSTLQFSATGTYSDGTTQNITAQSVWASSDTGVATISSGGVATARGVGSITISAQLDGITGSTTLTVEPIPLTITTASLSGGTLNIPYSATLAASGGIPPYSWLIVSGSLPTGLSLNGATGIISGTPTAGGTSGFTVQVNDAASSQQSASRVLSIAIATPVTLSSIAVTPISQSITVGATLQFTATGTYTDGTTQNITSQTTWASSDSIVASITSTGLATARTVGSSIISSTLGGITGSTILTVLSPPLVVTTVSLPGGTLNVQYSTTLAASGGIQPYFWMISAGSLPTGLSLNSVTGVVSGTPSFAGSSTFTVQVSDSGTPPQATTKTLSILIVTVPPISPAPVLDISVTTKQSAKSRTISSPSFSTAKTNELLIAFIASDGPASRGSQSISSVTGGGLTWTRRARANAQAGTAEIWQAMATNVLNNVVVTATRSNGSYQGMITVAAFQGCSLTTNGATASASAASGAPTVSLVSTRANSLVWGVGDDWDRAVVRTISSNQTKLTEFLAPAGDTFWVQYITAPIASAGMTSTISCTAPINDRWNLAAIEIVPQ